MSDKQNFILDLDQTIISAIPTEEYDDRDNKKARRFKFHNMEDIYIVFERPGIQEFLDFLFLNYNVSVWTAATKDYALFIIDKVILKKPERKINWIFFSYHCDISIDKKKTSKDLSMLWDVYGISSFNKHNTVILDDYYEDVYRPQRKNCIVAVPFEFDKSGSEEDTFLPELQKLLLGNQGGDIQELVPHINEVFKGRISKKH